MVELTDTKEAKLHREIPHLTTANSEPILALEANILNNQSEIEAWFRNAWPKTHMPITCSVDLRNAGFKVSAVDTNLFPAGFNNLNREFLPLCVQAAQYAIARYHPNCQRILIIAENHTRNTYYHTSLHNLQNIFLQAGYEVKIAQIDEGFIGTTVPADDGELEIHPVTREGDRLTSDGFNPCIILLNRDLSEGIPKELKGISQTITPLPELGWSSRLKSTHFEHYKDICNEFANEFNLDPWHIFPLFSQCKDIDFVKSEGIDRLAVKVDALLIQIKEKYTEYNIEHKPFVVVKSDSGTYGMGVMMVGSGDELLSMNRKQRVKMSTTKGRKPINQVIIQEGVYSFETYNDYVSEPVVYMIGHSVVGGFYRVHKNKGIAENLNSPGMEFMPLAFSNSCNTRNFGDAPNRFYIYGVIARLALLAAIKEIEEVINE